MAIKAVFGTQNVALFEKEALPNPAEQFSEYDNLNILISPQDIILI